jgi:hypothetical protein
VDDPSLCAGTAAETEAVTETAILVILDLDAGLAKCRNAPFHAGGRRDAVVLANDNKRGRIG